MNTHIVKVKVSQHEFEVLINPLLKYKQYFKVLT